MDKNEMTNALGFFEQGAESIRLAIQAEQDAEAHRELKRWNETLQQTNADLEAKRDALQAAIAHKEAEFAEAVERFREYAKLDARTARLEELGEKIATKTAELHNANHAWEQLRQKAHGIQL